VNKSGTRQKINDVIFSLTSAISHEMEPYVEDVCVGAATTSSIFFSKTNRRVNTYRQFNENEMDHKIGHYFKAMEKKIFLILK